MNEVKKEFKFHLEVVWFGDTPEFESDEQAVFAETETEEGKLLYISDISWLN